MGEEQLWTKDEWRVRFNRSSGPKDIGFGHVSEQVAAFKSPDVETLLDYYRAGLEKSKRYFLSLSNSALGRELDEPWHQPRSTVGAQHISVLGEIACSMSVKWLTYVACVMVRIGRNIDDWLN